MARTTSLDEHHHPEAHALVAAIRGAEAIAEYIEEPSSARKHEAYAGLAAIRLVLLVRGGVFSRRGPAPSDDEAAIRDSVRWATLQRDHRGGAPDENEWAGAALADELRDIAAALHAALDREG